MNRNRDPIANHGVGCDGSLQIIVSETPDHFV